MTPPPRLSDHLRAQVADDIRAHAGTPEGTVRALATKYGISKASVGRIADLNDLSDAWSSATHRTEAATAARSAYIARQRASLQEDLLDTAAGLLDRLHDNVIHLNVVKSEGMGAGEYVEHTALPAGPGEWRQTMNAVQAAVAQAVALAKLDNDTTTTDKIGGLLDQFMDDLATERTNEETPPDEPAAE